MHHSHASALTLATLLVAILSACATVQTEEDYGCRRTSEILKEPGWYRTCLAQKENVR